MAKTTVSRSDFSRHVFEKLADPDFARRLEVAREDGSKPIVIAMADDMLSRLMHDVAAAGECANVVVCLDKRVVIFGMCLNSEMSKADQLGAKWLDECTIAAFVTRLTADGGGGTYLFTPEVASGETSQGEAFLLDAA